ncbi:ADR1-like 2 [Actinidia rufa]|uniref:ADR1-like 2 n=1 Tax=Actinidia rufa TaxID=165716 RepID=A0A7J0EKB6_9ERIC|nr:ADR1-like 2 [Actinidia rufa]
MAVTDFIAGKVATELLEMLDEICRKSFLCKPTAAQLVTSIQDLLPTIQEIKYTGVAIPPPRQRQIDALSETLVRGRDLAHEILNSGRWNFLKNVQLARKMEKLEKKVSRFVNGPLQAHVLADVHHLRHDSEKKFDRIENSIRQLEQRLGAAKSGCWGRGRRVVGGGGEEGGGGGEVRGGKTTLAREICRDDDVRSYFNDRVLFLTVSQSPNVEQLRSKIWGMIIGNDSVGSSDTIPPLTLQYDFRIVVKTLVILDDVWSLPVLDQLILKTPGCKTLVVSRFKLSPSVINCTYELELLREDEAVSLFCHAAFGQNAIPSGSNKKLIKQVVDECKGLPLALKVIGASLRDKPEMFWTSAKSILTRSQPICESHEIQLLERMRLSIDCLPEKKLFAILVELADKNLLTPVKDARYGDIYSSYYDISVYQHDVLRDLAIYLSNRENVNQRRRLLMPRRETGIPKEWERNVDKPFNAQIVSVHTGEMREMDWFSMEFPKAEVLILNFSSSEYFLPPFIDNMPKLKTLVLINYSTSNAVLHNLSVVTNLSNLRSLWFEKISVPQLPETTLPLKNLRKISLVLCKINTSLDDSVVGLPYLFPCLSELTMDHCVDLTELPPSICKMNKLKSLSVTNCHSLRELPTDLGKLSSLQILRTYACPCLRRLPPGICSLVLLQYLDISQCVNLASLPEGIGGLKCLEKIDMRECPQIRNLPRSAASLRSLHRVICDEEVSWLWREVEKSIPDLCIQVAEACFNLDWLAE